MKSNDVTDFVVKAFLVLALITVAMLAWENLALSDLWFSNPSDTITNREQFAALIEAELVELTLSILVIFSLVATLFSSWFAKRLEESLEAAKSEAIEKVMEKAEVQIESNKKEAYHAASANYYHELAFSTYETAGGAVEFFFEIKDKASRDKKEIEDSHKMAKSGIHRGLYYTERGLECVARYDPSTDDFFLHRRVPWQLKNSRIWFLGAELIVLKEARLREQYDEPLRYIDELREFVLSGTEPLPTWHNVYESSAFFLFQLHVHFPVDGFGERAEQLLSKCLSGKAPKSSLNAAPEHWIKDVRSQYEMAGLLQSPPQKK